MPGLRQSLGARFVAGLCMLAAIVAALVIALLGALDAQRAALERSAAGGRALVSLSALERAAGAFVSRPRPPGGGPRDGAREIEAMTRELEPTLREAGIDARIAAAVASDALYLSDGAAEPVPRIRQRFETASNSLALVEDRVVESNLLTRTQAGERVSTATRIAAFGGALVVALVVGLTLLLRRRVLAPVSALAHVAERIAAGDLSRRVDEPPGADEVARMHRSFNRMADELQSALDESRSSRRIREELFAVISHELRTPLTSIVGYVELLAEDVAGSEVLSEEERRRFVEIVERNSRHLLRLVGDLLLAAQIEEGRMELERRRYDIAELAREAVEEIAPAARSAGITLASAIEGPLVATVDSARLAQAFRNLLSSAVKFTPAGGEIGVAVSRPPQTPANGPGAAVMVEFWDTGPGLSDAEQERLFEGLYRAPDGQGHVTPGVGLGLVITRAIVEAHGGRLELESSQGGGTTFRCLFPLG